MVRPLDELNLRRSAPPDAWVRCLRWFSVCGWTVLVAACYFLGSAKPAMETFFDRRHQVYVRKLWNMELAEYGFLLLGIGLAIGLAGVALNLWRRQVKQEEFRLNLALLTASSLVLILCYLWYFHGG